MKLREAVGYRRESVVLGGEVQMDGKYTDGHVKKKNTAEDRVGRP